jgi:hypothetical protein
LRSHPSLSILAVNDVEEAMRRDPAKCIPAAEVAKITVRQFREGATGSVVPAAKV